MPYVRNATNGIRFKTVADVGSGGGFPGLVAAACLPDHDFTLIEPMERRIEWLHECVGLMQLQNVEIIRGRSDAVIQQVRKREIHPFAVVTCRAVAPMTKLSGWTLPLLKPSGQLIALKDGLLRLKSTRLARRLQNSVVVVHASLRRLSDRILSLPTW